MQHLPRSMRVPGMNQVTQTQSSAELLSLLACPVCRGSLAEQSSGYACSKCGKRFPEVRGVVRFVDEGNYADSFGYQWKRFQTTQLDNERRNISEQDFIDKTG